MQPPYGIKCQSFPLFGLSFFWLQRAAAASFARRNRSAGPSVATPFGTFAFPPLRPILRITSDTTFLVRVLEPFFPFAIDGQNTTTNRRFSGSEQTASFRLTCHKRLWDTKFVPSGRVDVNTKEAIAPSATSSELTDILMVQRTPAFLPEENIKSNPGEFGDLVEKPTRPSQGPVRNGKQSTYFTEIEVDCDECGGSGFDPGGIDPWGPEVCPKCHGAKTQTISRNYLAEAFRIAANPESTRPVERQHLVAIVQYCREAVSAIVALPEIYECPKTAEPTTSSRHSRIRSQSHTASYQKEKEEC